MMEHMEEMIESHIKCALHRRFEGTEMYGSWRSITPDLFFESPPGRINGHTKRTYKRRTRMEGMKQMKQLKPVYESVSKNSKICMSVLIDTLGFNEWREQTVPDLFFEIPPGEIEEHTKEELE